MCGHTYNQFAYFYMLQIQNAFGLFGIDFLVKSVDGMILDENLLQKMSNDTIIVQKNNSSEIVQVQQKTSPITQ